MKLPQEATKLSERKRIVMLATHPDTRGGISAVINVYREAGLFARFPIFAIATHCDGSHFAKFRIAWLAMLRFLLELALGRIGLLHVHVSSRASFWRKCLFLVPSYFLGIPAIVHLHGSEFASFYEVECGPVRKRLVRWVFDRASCVVVLSETWKRWVTGISTNTHIEVLYNPVLVQEKAQDYCERDYGSLLFLGRLGKRKGTYDLLDAVAMLRSSYPMLRVVLAGDGQLEQLATRARELGLGDCVTIKGWVGGDEKKALLQKAWLYVLPSYNEGLPMSVLEAMAAALPVIATTVGGIPEAVRDGSEGFLVRPGDIRALAEKLGSLLDDKEMCHEMGRAAWSRALSTFSTKAVIPRLEGIYARFGFEAAVT